MIGVLVIPVPEYVNPSNINPVVQSHSMDNSCFNTIYMQPSVVAVHDLRQFDDDQLGVQF